MDELKTKIRELLPNAYFLDKEVLGNIKNMIDVFSEKELKNIHKLLKSTNEKTMKQFSQLLQKNPRFFQQAQDFLIKKKEALSDIEDDKELTEILNNLKTI